MDGLTSTILRCRLQLKLDNKTEGFGNCFPNAIVQQCRRHEIRKWLQENRKESIVYNHQTLRNKVTSFALKSKHRTLTQYKTDYENILEIENKKSWNEYWHGMVQEGTWVDSVFVQMTAWFLGLDILILTTSAAQQNPFIRITGNIANTLEFSAGPPILIGNYTNVHYQSIIPLNMDLKFDQQPIMTSEENEAYIENIKKDEFVYIYGGLTLVFHSVETNKLECPVCGKSFQRLISHITSKTCRIASMNIDIEEMTNQLNAFKEGFRLEKNRKRQKKWRENLQKENNGETIKTLQNNQKKKSRAKSKDERGSQIINEEQSKHRKKSHAKCLEEKGSMVIKDDQNKRKMKSQANLKEVRGAQEIKDDQNKRKMKSQANLKEIKGTQVIKDDQNKRKL